MGPALAAVVAVVAALVETTIAPRLQVDGAQLQILFIFAVVLTLSVGFEVGLCWAFVGGVTVDLLTGRPLGSTAFSLVVSVGAAALIGHVLSRSLLFGPVIAIAILSAFYFVTLIIITGVVHAPMTHIEVPVVVAVTVLNTIAGFVATLPFAAWRRREQGRERAVW